MSLEATLKKALVERDEREAVERDEREAVERDEREDYGLFLKRISEDIIKGLPQIAEVGKSSKEVKMALIEGLARKQVGVNVVRDLFELLLEAGFSEKETKSLLVKALNK